jgi:hypothetical protein
MSFITDLFSGGASHLVDSIGGVLDNIVTTKEEKMTLDNEIKKAEMQYELESAKLNFDEKKLSFDDINSARTNQTAIQTSANATLLSKNISSYLAIAATLLCFTLFFILVFNPNNSLGNADKQILTYILGVLSALLSQVYSYYFGSSSGSADKSKTLAQALEAKNNPS